MTLTTLFGPKTEKKASNTIYLVAVHLKEGGTTSEDIVEVIWVASNIKSGRCSTAAIVNFLEKGRIIKVSDGVQEATVEMVRPEGRPSYIRMTGDPSENGFLMALPRFK